jgi:SHS2 domain-containing protein
MHRWTSHTGEEQLEIEAPSPVAVLTQAIDAFGRAVELERGGEPATQEISLEERDLDALLVALIEELIFLADTESFVPDGAELTLAGTHLTGVVHGRRATIRPLVKAATFAGIRFEEADGVWRARVVLDV